jgi:hypothetical protein
MMPFIGAKIEEGAENGKAKLVRAIAKGEQFGT